MELGARDSAAKAQRRVSVVIPTLNEASRLPVLLDRLSAQTRQPDEVVVADARSADDTRAIASAWGAAVVDGGMPACGRNAGAAASHGELILFMDADAEPEPDFLAKALAEFDRRGLDLATAPMRAARGEAQHRFWIYFSEAYIRALQRISPHAVGLCIIVTRELHERIGGFDETLVLAEDHDYARRAAEHGRFGILRSVRARTSMRRVKQEGRRKLARVLIYSELQTLAGKPIREIPFSYQFGEFEGEKDAHHTGSWRRFARMLAKPSSELQGDAIGIFVLAVLAALATTVGLASFSAPALAYLGLVGLGAIAVASGWVSLRKLRFERSYGEYVSSSVAVASDDIIDNDGTVLVRAGIDEIAEVHVMGSLDKMAQLTRSGMAGRLEIIAVGMAELASIADDMGDPFYANVTYITGHSELTHIMFNIGFHEIEHPPRYDWINRLEKRLLAVRLSIQQKRKHDGDSDGFRMAVMSKEEFTSPEFRERIRARVARAEHDLERARAKAAARDAG